MKPTLESYSYKSCDGHLPGFMWIRKICGVLVCCQSLSIKPNQLSLKLTPQTKNWLLESQLVFQIGPPDAELLVLRGVYCFNGFATDRSICPSLVRRPGHVLKLDLKLDQPHGCTWRYELPFCPHEDLYIQHVYKNNLMGNIHEYPKSASHSCGFSFLCGPKDLRAERFA